jgi:hypothetical protein
MEKTLHDVNKDKSWIHDHPGASAHIPKIQKLLWDFLNDEKLN